MNKKLNTVFFLLGATIFNVLITIIVFLAVFLLYINFLMPLLPDNSRAWAFPVIFIFAIVAAFFIYRLTINTIVKKVDIDKYFDPIFVFRKKRS